VQAATPFFKGGKPGTASWEMVPALARNALAFTRA
jgi:hypothetical protein